MNITCKSDSEDIRIYIAGILHLRFPRDKNVKIHSWVEGHSRCYYIEITSAGDTDICMYNSRSMWSKILKLIDKHI